MNELLIWKYMFVSVCFLYAAYTDYHTHKVPNKLWLLMLPFALFSLFLSLPLPKEWVGIVVMWCMAYAFWFFGWWGAADAKAIMLFSMFFPQIIIVPMCLWVVLGACILQIIQKISIKESLHVAKPFFPALCISVIATTLICIM